MKAIIKYPGSKWLLANWIINFFPKHHSYLEPFFGAGAVLFNKPRSNIETVNDLDGNVVNLFECIRSNPGKLADIIYKIPYAREVYKNAFHEEPKDPFEKAVNFYIRLNMGHGFRTNGEKVGWKNDVQGREKAYAAQDWCNLPEKIMQAAERLRGVQIDNRPAIELIQRFNFENVLIYCDPPYMLNTRHGKMNIFDAKCEFLIDTTSGLTRPTSEIQHEWKNYIKEEKEGWYTTKLRRARANARDVLCNIFEDFEDEGYDDMASRCWDDTSEEQIARLQEVLDDICKGSAFEVYEREEKIDIN